LDRIIKLLKSIGLKCHVSGADSPMNVADYKYIYHFEDGGFEIYSGNYFFGPPGHGAFVVGFKAFRWTSLSYLPLGSLFRVCPEKGRTKGGPKTKIHADRQCALATCRHCLVRWEPSRHLFGKRAHGAPTRRFYPHWRQSL
jgi:hypothetical protein